MRAVMIYVQHLLGIGHLMRARVIAEALADAGFAVHLVSGGTAIGGRMPRNVNVVQLPPIRVADASFNPLRDAGFTPIDDAYREARRTELLAAYDAARPDAVLFETFPFGRRQLRFELVPLLERIDATRPRPLVVSSVREILQVQAKPEREREMQEWAARWFDAVLVHGDPRFARFEETYPLAGALAPPVHYTGFVLTPGPRGDGPAPPRDEIVVSAGGGGVGIHHLANALAAQKLSRHGHLTWRVLAGPNIPDEGYRRLMADAAPTAIVERSRADFQALLRRARVSVSQGGYNTVLDVLSSGTRPVIVPFTGNGETEQRERGERLARLNVAVVLDDRALTPQALADAVDDAATRSFARFDFDCEGAAGTAEFFVRALAGGRPATRRTSGS